jgi:hypothetical protein
MRPEPGETETVIAGTVRFAEVDLVVSATEVAVSTTDWLLGGGLAGALYVTVVLVGLLKLPGPVAGERAHVTPWFVGSF